MIQNDKPNRKRRPATKIFVRLVAIAIGTLVVVSIPILTIVLPDQMRSIPTPEAAMALLLQYDEVEDSSPPTSQDQSTTTTTTLAVYPNGIDLHPIPDPDAIPEAYREQAREWNQAVDELVSELMQIAKDAASIKRNRLREMHNKVNAIDKRYQNLSNQYLEIFPPEIRGQVLANKMPGFAWYDLAERVKILLLPHVWWWKAHIACYELATWEREVGFGTPESRAAIWEYEVYLYKQDREHGRRRLLVRTLERAWRSMRRSATDEAD